MSAMPKRIWVVTDYDDDKDGDWFREPPIICNASVPGCGYVRADVADELLAAARKAIEEYDAFRTLSAKGYDQIKAAIAKAEGEP